MLFKIFFFFIFFLKKYFIKNFKNGEMFFFFFELMKSVSLKMKLILELEFFIIIDRLC